MLLRAPLVALQDRARRNAGAQLAAIRSELADAAEAARAQQPPQPARPRQ